MDPLSDIVSLLKPRSYITAGFDAGGEWALQLDDLAGRIKCYAVLRGHCWLSLGGASEPLRVNAGDVFILPSGTALTIGSDPTLAPTLASAALAPDRHGETVVWNGGGGTLLVGSRFEIKGRHVEGLLRGMPQIIHVQGAADRETLRSQIGLMMEELRDRRPGADAIAQQLAQMMLVQTLRFYLAQRNAPRTGWLAALADPGLGAAIAAIHARPAHPWRVETLAALAGMSRTVFARRFHEAMGEPPLAYVTRWRMMLAAEQLMAGDTSIARIAEAVGYESESAFGAAFKRIMGCPPGSYLGLASADG